MCYFFEFVKFWENTFLDKENIKLVTIIFQDKELPNDAKFKSPKKYVDKITFWTKNDVKCKSYISRIYLGHIQQEFQAVKIDLLTHSL